MSFANIGMLPCNAGTDPALFEAFLKSYLKISDISSEQKETDFKPKNFGKLKVHADLMMKFCFAARELTQQAADYWFVFQDREIRSIHDLFQLVSEPGAGDDIDLYVDDILKVVFDTSPEALSGLEKEKEEEALKKRHQKRLLFLRAVNDRPEDLYALLFLKDNLSFDTYLLLMNNLHLYVVDDGDPNETFLDEFLVYIQCQAGDINSVTEIASKIAAEIVSTQDPDLFLPLLKVLNREKIAVFFKLLPPDDYVKLLSNPILKSFFMMNFCHIEKGKQKEIYARLRIDQLVEFSKELPDSKSELYEFLFTDPHRSTIEKQAFIQKVDVGEWQDIYDANHASWCDAIVPYLLSLSKSQLKLSKGNLSAYFDHIFVTNNEDLLRFIFSAQTRSLAKILEGYRCFSDQLSGKAKSLLQSSADFFVNIIDRTNTRKNPFKEVRAFSKYFFDNLSAFDFDDEILTFYFDLCFTSDRFSFLKDVFSNQKVIKYLHLVPEKRLRFAERARSVEKDALSAFLHSFIISAIAKELYNDVDKKLLWFKAIMRVRDRLDSTLVMGVLNILFVGRASGVPDASLLTADKILSEFKLEERFEVFEFLNSLQVDRVRFESPSDDDSVKNLKETLKDILVGLAAKPGADTDADKSLLTIFQNRTRRYQDELHLLKEHYMIHSDHVRGVNSYFEDRVYRHRGQEFVYRTFCRDARKSKEFLNKIDFELIEKYNLSLRSLSTIRSLHFTLSKRIAELLTKLSDSKAEFDIAGHGIPQGSNSLAIKKQQLQRALLETYLTQLKRLESGGDIYSALKKLEDGEMTEKEFNLQLVLFAQSTNLDLGIETLSDIEDKEKAYKEFLFQHRLFASTLDDAIAVETTFHGETDRTGGLQHVNFRTTFINTRLPMTRKTEAQKESLKDPDRSAQPGELEFSRQLRKDYDERLADDKTIKPTKLHLIDGLNNSYFVMLREVDDKGDVLTHQTAEGQKRANLSVMIQGGVPAYFGKWSSNPAEQMEYDKAIDENFSAIDLMMKGELQGALRSALSHSAEVSAQAVRNTLQFYDVKADYLAIAGLFTGEPLAGETAELNASKRLQLEELVYRKLTDALQRPNQKTFYALDRVPINFYARFIARRLVKKVGQRIEEQFLDDEKKPLIGDQVFERALDASLRWMKDKILMLPCVNGMDRSSYIVWRLSAEIAKEWHHDKQAEWTARPHLTTDKKTLFLKQHARAGITPTGLTASLPGMTRMSRDSRPWGFEYDDFELFEDDDTVYISRGEHTELLGLEDRIYDYDAPKLKGYVAGELDISVESKELNIESCPKFGKKVKPARRAVIQSAQVAKMRCEEALCDLWLKIGQHTEDGRRNLNDVLYKLTSSLSKELTADTHSFSKLNRITSLVQAISALNDNPTEQTQKNLERLLEKGKAETDQQLSSWYGFGRKALGVFGVSMGILTAAVGAVGSFWTGGATAGLAYLGLKIASASLALYSPVGIGGGFLASIFGGFQFRKGKKDKANLKKRHDFTEFFSKADEYTQLPEGENPKSQLTQAVEEAVRARQA